MYRIQRMMIIINNDSDNGELRIWFIQIISINSKMIINSTFRNYRFWYIHLILYYNKILHS